ncbi:hypothetical protein [Streptomyces johnsoniae]|uniref:Uncharacterized protein n=1 Tax=Streptomyces johnsoniae TaxID=3075532 RepID=A0ABU2S032_9ACTN|nr:hypothetical protein [Streptomyces sp. DSM 41886]MDT0442348.1 hypothetical protein [Streptomyces sp. DSM 41886]
MTGPEHYREAERLLERSQDGDRGYGPTTADDIRIRSEMVALAQAHATLALAAATALTPVAGIPDTRELGSSDYEKWQEAAG